MILNVSLDEFVHCRHFYVPAFFLSYSPFLIYKKPCPPTHLHMAMASVVDHHYKRRLGWRRRRIAAHSSSIQTFLSDYYFRTSTATKKSTTKKQQSSFFFSALPGNPFMYSYKSFKCGRIRAKPAGLFFSNMS